VVDGYDDNCPHRYQKALSSAIAQAVEFEDQAAIRMHVYLNVSKLNRWSEGIYTIPPTDVKIICKRWCGGAGCVPDRNRCEIPAELALKVARLVTQQSEPSPVKASRTSLDDEAEAFFNENYSSAATSAFLKPFIINTYKMAKSPSPVEETQRYTRKQVIEIIEDLLNRPDLLADVTTNEDTNHTAETLLEIAEHELKFSAVEETQEELISVKEVVRLISEYWRFDSNQVPRSTWHEKQDLIEILTRKKQ
jgi:hypothetical protein